MRRTLPLLLALGLAACSGRPTLDGDKLSQRELNLEEFFAGRFLASCRLDSPNR